MTIYRNSTFRGRNLSLPQLPREGGMHGTPPLPVRRRTGGSRHIRIHSAPPFGPAALPCQGQIIPVQWSRLSGEGNCPKADNYPWPSEGESEGAIEGRTRTGEIIMGDSVRFPSDGWTVAAVRRSSMKDVKLGVLQGAAQLERKEMVRRYRISDQVSYFKSRLFH